MAFSVQAFKYHCVTSMDALAAGFHGIQPFLMFALAAFFIVLMCAARSLRHTRDVLDGTLRELKRANEALQMENAGRGRAEEALKTTRDQLRTLSAGLLSVREEEATRISREIHDELGQNLTGLKMNLQRAERKLEELDPSPPVNTVLDTIVSATGLVDELVAAVQEIAAELRPGVLDKLGLGSALQYEARRFLERTGISWEVRLPEIEPDLSAEVSTALFRIFQECLTNIARHAHATKIEAALELEGEWVILRVKDNGRGITDAGIANTESIGLLGMKERTALLGGKIVFQRATLGGTIVTTRVPQSGTMAQAKGSL